MDMADYSEALDPAYTTLEFENMQVLPLGTGECARTPARPPHARLGLSDPVYTELQLWLGALSSL